jgi:hypothetical protein
MAHWKPGVSPTLPISPAVLCHLARHSSRASFNLKLCIANGFAITAAAIKASDSAPISYRQLDPTLREIQLLELKPAKSLSDEIECRLFVEPLQRNELLCAWGDSAVNQSIRVKLS